MSIMSIFDLPPREPRAINPRTRASLPGMVSLSGRRIARLHPELFAARSWMKWNQEQREKNQQQLAFFMDHLFFGDSCPAVVMELSPLVIAAYSSDIDCVSLLVFVNSGAQLGDKRIRYAPNLARHLIGEHGLKKGSRLLSVNLYVARSQGDASDLVRGPRASQSWGNFMPLIADFLSDDKTRIAERKSHISESDWKRTQHMAEDILRQKSYAMRDGRPRFSHRDGRIEGEGTD